MIKIDVEKLKKIYLMIDNAFAWIKETAIGKFVIEKILFRSKSFYSVFYTLILILISQLSTLKYAEELVSKIGEQINTSEGFINFMWHVASFFAPSGNGYIIFILLLVIPIMLWLRNKELNSNNIDSLLRNLKDKSENILYSINTYIDFNEKHLEIDRIDLIKDLKQKLLTNNLFIISGQGGVGKTAVIKKLFIELKETTKFYIFKASEFNINNINELFKNHTFMDFIDIHKNDQEKIIVIDSAEKLLDNKYTNQFQEILSSLIKNNWKIIFTTRENYLNDLNFQFIEVYKINPINFNIRNLDIEELNELSDKYSFPIPIDDKLTELIKNPFYLNEYLSLYKENKLDYISFKQKLWDKNIKKTSAEREQCFLMLSKERADKGSFFIKINCTSNSLENLRKDDILGYETAGYFITHDIYEEWALEKIIDIEFLDRENNLIFFENIGNSLAIRRSFRNWMSEKLLLEDNNIKLFIEEIINDEMIEVYWKDEILVSILLSNYSGVFFNNYKSYLFKNANNILNRISFLLRLACKEADSSLFEKIGLKDITNIDATYIFTQPKGNGWKSFIEFIYKNIDMLKLDYINTVLPILHDWNSKYQGGETTQQASLISLKYYELINIIDYYRDDDHIKSICQIIINGSSEITKELGSVFDLILEDEGKSPRDDYYKLAEMILKGWDGLLISKNMPEYVMRLADKFWKYTPVKLPEGIYHAYERDEVETHFGLEKYRFDYFPSSAYQTPIYSLLKSNFKNTIDFILTFTNKAIEKYAKSNWEYKEDIKEVNLSIEDIIVKQYHSSALWNTYRGTSSPISPNLMQSIHMALEKYLLEIAKYIDQNILESWLEYLLFKSKSSSISAVVTSVVLAYPDKTFNIAIILFKTEEFIQSDLIRQMEDRSVNTLYGIGYGLNYWHKLYQNERLKTCEDKHRSSHLESLFLNYQVFRSKDVSEKEVEQRQKVLWKILDNYYEELPPENEQLISHKTWRMFLSRMDKRKMDIEVEEVENGFQLTFNSELPPVLKNHSEKAQIESKNTIKYTSLYLWSINKIEVNQDYKKYKEFENNPLIALQHVQEVINTPKENRDYIFQDEIFPNVCIILLKDYLEKLSMEDKEFCRDIIMSFATLPFAKNYFHQISDGTKSAISFLPIIINIFPELGDNVKVILLMNLFNDQQIGMSGIYFYDYVIEAIIKYFDEESYYSFLIGYLLLKPKYDTDIQKLVKETHAQRFETVDYQQHFENLMNDNEDLIKSIVQNTINEKDINIEQINIYTLVVALKLISKRVDYFQSKELLKKIIKRLSVEFFKKGRDENLRYEIESVFTNSLSIILLNITDKDYLKDLLILIKDNINDSEITAKLLTDIILAQDKLDDSTNFWYIWEFLEDKVIELCKNGYSYIDSIINTYLLAWSPYGAIWHENAKEWHSLKEENKIFFKRISNSIGYKPPTLYAISKLVTGIGALFLNSGVGWIADMINNNKNLLTDKLEPNTLFQIENLIREYILKNNNRIKHEKKIKSDLLVILNFLVEKGSALGYMLRERIY